MGGPPDLGDAAEDALQLGEIELASQLMASTPPGFPVWPENMIVTDAWMMVCTQWLTEGLANGQVLWLGLNYAGVDVSLNRGGVTITPEQWSNLRMMERVASAVLNGNRG